MKRFLKGEKRMAPAGKLIVIEGVDGSGKTVQTKYLVRRLGAQGYSVQERSLPQYGKKAAGPTEEYLRGTYGDPTQIDPYIASVLFSVDHFDMGFGLQECLRAGDIIVMNRYVDSNAGHQGGKITDASDRARFLRWLYDFEYQTLKVPKPDMVVILHVPAEVAQKLAKERKGGSAADLHEANLTHLKNAEAAYLFLAAQYPADHILLPCVEGGALLTPEEIHERIWAIVRKEL